MKNTVKHIEMNRDSILKSIADGAKSVSQIALAHGYQKPVSGGVTAKIRLIVPEVAERLAGTYVEPVVEVKEVKAVKVKPVKAVKAEKPVKAVKAAKEPKVAKVKAEKAEKPVKAEKPHVMTVQRKSPYGGKLYGAVYAEAVAAGRTEFRPFVELTAKKLNLTEQQVFVAANVMRIPKHQSNGNRSMDIADARGMMHLVPVAPVEVPEVSEAGSATEKIEAVG